MEDVEEDVEDNPVFNWKFNNSDKLLLLLTLVLSSGERVDKDTEFEFEEEDVVLLAKEDGTDVSSLVELSSSFIGKLYKELERLERVEPTESLLPLFNLFDEELER